MSIFSNIAKLFKRTGISSGGLSSKQQLDVSSMLPTHFKSGPHKPIHVLAIESLAKNSSPIDAFVIHFDSLKTTTQQPYEESLMARSGFFSNRKTPVKQECRIELVYDISHDGPPEVMKWVRENFEGTTRSTRTIHIKQLDQVGTTVKTTTLNNCYVSHADFGDLTFDASDESSKVILTLVSEDYL